MAESAQAGSAAREQIATTLAGNLGLRLLGLAGFGMSTSEQRYHTPEAGSSPVDQPGNQPGDQHGAALPGLPPLDLQTGAEAHELQVRRRRRPPGAGNPRLLGRKGARVGVRQGSSRLGCLPPSGRAQSAAARAPGWGLPGWGRLCCSGAAREALRA